MTRWAQSLRMPLLAGLRHYRRSRARTALAVLGIALGTALLVGIRGALATATGAFEQAADTLVGRTTDVVRGGPSGVPVDALAEVVRRAGIQDAAPVIEAPLRAADLPERYVLRLFGCDPLVEPSVRGWRRAGAPSAASAPAAGGADWTLLMTVDGGFLATRAALDRLGCEPGRSCAFTVYGRRQLGECVGVLPVGRGLAEDLVVVDIATAQRWLSRPDHVDRIDLVLQGESQRAGVLAALPNDLRLEQPIGRAAFTELTRAFRVNLEALGMLSLLVGAFLVHAAMATAVLARRSQFAVMRTLGASARQLLASVLAESLVLGAVGSMFGVGLGILFARGLVGPLVRTLNDHYATFSLHSLDVPLLTLASSVALALVAAVLAAVGPARDAARTPPRAVFVQDRMSHDEEGAPARWLLLLLVPGVWLVAAAGNRIGMAYIGVLLLLLVLAAFVPALVGMLLRLGILLLRRRGSWMVYIVRSAWSCRRRTAPAMAALVLALATTMGLGMLIQSFRGTVDVWLQQVLPADVYVSVPAGVDERTGAVMQAEQVEALLGVDGIAEVSRYRRLQMDVADAGGSWQSTEVVAVDLSAKVLQGFSFTEGDPERARRGLAAGEALWVAEPLAFARGIVVGDRLVLQTDRGPLELPVSGIYRDYGSAKGVIQVSMRWLGDRLPSALAFEAEAGIDAEELERRMEPICIASQPRLRSATRQGLVERSLEMFDRTFAITTAMRMLCVLVAFLGIYGAFSALQFERASELAVLRTLGATPRHVLWLVLGQTGLLGLCCGLLSIPVGTGLGWVLVHVVNRGSFGWTLLDLSLPPQLFLEVLLLAVVASVLSGLQPAFRFIRLQPVAALREG